MLRRRLTWAIASVSLLIGLGIAVGEAQRQMPDGVPPKGSGPVEVTNVRVVDGDSIDAYVDGKRTAIGLIGVDAPSHNTECGKQATGMLWGLVKGGLRLEDDPDQTLDDRKRRMYRVTMGDGRSLEEALVQAGVAKVTGKGAQKFQLATAEAEARTEQRGCAWGGAPATPKTDAPAASNAAPVASALNLLSTLGFGSITQPAVASAAPLAAPVYPSGFQHDQVATGLAQATNIEFGPDGRMFIAQQSGVVRLYKNGALLPTPVIDLQDRVNDHWDHGLLGMAVDPNFSQNGYLYLLYTLETNAGNYEGKKVGRLARYTVVNDVANKNTEFILLGSQSSANDGCELMPVTADCIPSEGLSHSVGALEFADDGTLFMTTGDSASFNVVDDLALRAQNIDSLGGKVLRINRANGQGFADNPHYNNNLSANRSKVWARGVRNAYRFNIKPDSQIPYLGDVGWNSTEEVSAATKGANLGWPCYEGNAQQTGYASKSVCQTLYGQGAAAHQGPIIDWGHNFGGTCCGAAATGGTFLKGTAYPAQYQGAYFYADFAKGFIRYLRTDANDDLVPGSDQPFATDADGPVDIELGPDQNLYYVAINSAQVRRIRYIGAGNRPPVAALTANPTEGLAPLAVQFSSAGTLDQDADTLSYSWNFGDGSPASSQPNPSKSYSNNGTYNVVLTVNDGRGGSDTATTTITVGNRRPTATITSPSPTLTYKVGDTITLTGTASDPDGGTPSLSWQVNAKHCPGGACHTHPPIFSGTGASTSFVVPDHGDENHFEIALTATDSGGLKDTKTILIQPQTVQLTLASSPAGRQLIYSGTADIAPFVKTTVPGSKHTIEPGLNTGYRFDAWSDGGAAQHDITVPATNSTITATFSSIPTVTFDDKTGQDQPLNGQYPSGVIDWGTGRWYHAAAWEQMTTKSASFLGATQTSATFTFMSPRKLLSIRAYNGGFTQATVTIACAGLTTKSQVLNSKQMLTIPTGWNAGCTTVTITSSNGWDTNFDDIVHDSAGAADTTPPTITNPQATASSNGATITWTTNEAADRQVEFGTTAAYGSLAPATPGTPLGTSHSVPLTGLQPNTLYNYRVKSKDAAGNLATSGNFTFTTQALDTTAPVISAVQATAISSNGATITWTTNEAADRQVEFGTTTAYGSLAPATPGTPLGTSHSVPLTGLQPNTLYNYRVKSRDAAGNLATSGNFTFTTTAQPTSQTVTFNDKSGQDQPLSGEYPAGVMNWGPDGWYHSGPWGSFTTKSASFGGPGQTQATVSFVTPRRLVSVRVYNGGGASTTITLSCAGQPTKTQAVSAGQVATITTAWTGTCTSLTVGSTNGWDTNFDDFVIDAS